MDLLEQGKQKDSILIFQFVNIQIPDMETNICIAKIPLFSSWKTSFLKVEK